MEATQGQGLQQTTFASHLMSFWFLFSLQPLLFMQRTVCVGIICQHLASPTLQISCFWPWIFSAGSKWDARGNLCSQLPHEGWVTFPRDNPQQLGMRIALLCLRRTILRCPYMALPEIPSRLVLQLFTEVISSMMQFSINFTSSVLLFQFPIPVTWVHFPN